MDIVLCLLAGAVGFALASWLYGSYISKLSDDNDALWDEIDTICSENLRIAEETVKLQIELQAEKLKTRANENN